ESGSGQHCDTPAQRAGEYRPEPTVRAEAGAAHVRPPGARHLDSLLARVRGSGLCLLVALGVALARGPGAEHAVARRLRPGRWAAGFRANGLDGRGAQDLSAPPPQLPRGVLRFAPARRAFYTHVFVVPAGDLDSAHLRPR